MRALRQLAAAWSFLTPLPPPLSFDGDDFARAPRWFPLVGLVLGLAFAAIAALPLPALSLAALLVVAHAGLTGGLHLDGLADCADALGGGRGDRSRMLAILKDPLVGAHGAVAVGLGLLARAAGAHGVLDRPEVLVAAPVLGRWLAVALIEAFPYVREQGIGAAFAGRVRRDDVIWPGVFAFTFAVAVAGPAAALLGLAAGLGFALFLRSRLGGLTGDGYGAAVELCEVSFLLAAGAA